MYLGAAVPVNGPHEDGFGGDVRQVAQYSEDIEDCHFVAGGGI
jgi:hypothetical protein